MMGFRKREYGIADSLIHLEMITKFFVPRDCFIPVRNQCVRLCAFISASAVNCFIASFFIDDSQPSLLATLDPEMFGLSLLSPLLPFVSRVVAHRVNA